MPRERSSELDAPINIAFRNWSDFGDAKVKAPRFIMKPTTFFHDKRLEMRPELYRFFDYLIYHASVQSTPGVIFGDAHSLSRECRCHARSVPGYVRELIRMQLIQDLGEVAAPRLEERRGEERRPFAAWVYDVVQLKHYPQDTHNSFLTREIFGKEIWQKYPRPDSGAFEQVYAYLSRIVHDHAWLSFTQTCLRNYQAQKRKHENTPAWHSPQKFFTGLEWWNYFRNEDGTLPARFNGALTYVTDEEATAAVAGAENIIYPVRDGGGETVDDVDTRGAPLSAEDKAARFAALKNSLKGKIG